MHKFKMLYSMLSKYYQSRLSWVLVAACLMAVLEALGIVSIFYFFSFITEPSSKEYEGILKLINLSTTKEDTLKVGVVVLIIIVGKNVYALWNSWYQNHYISYVRHTLSVDLLSSIMRNQYSYFITHNGDVLIARFLTDVDRISDSYLRGLIALISESMIAIAIAIILLMNDFIGTLIIIFGFSIVGFIFHIFLKKYAGDTSHEYTKAQHARYLTGGTIMSGIKDIKSGCREDFFQDIFSTFSEKFSKIQIIQTMILASPRLVIETIAFFVVIASLIVVSLSDEGVNDILPTIAIYGAAAYRILPSLNRIISSIQQIKFADEPIVGIYKMMNESENDHHKEGVQKLSHIRFEKSITVSNVSFCYPDSAKRILKDISITINKNEFIGIVGESGSGKSTLIDVIMSLLYPATGFIKIDNKIITSSNSRNWRNNIGYVPQSIFLLDDTLEKNIAFGRDIDTQEIYRVSKMAQIDKFISTLPDGYDTNVGEDGVRLSGGQRQRIGIARALYGGIATLILDEATSALDNKTEYEVTQSILSLSGKVTLIVVAHRISTIKNADRLLVLDNGTLVSEGSFEELKDNCSVFKKVASYGSE